MKSAGHMIVDTLAGHGVERVYSVPGESFLDVLDGLHGSSITNVVCRQEGGAGFMALAEGRLTGRPGVAMVTRGPGAANLFIAAHCAHQDATPLVAFIGLVPIADRRRESFQEFSLDEWFGSTVKKVFTLEDPTQASDMVAAAMHLAVSGRPGPVVVGLPEDILTQAAGDVVRSPRAVAAPAPSPADLEELTVRLGKAERPLVVAGGEGFAGDLGRRLADWCEVSHVPVLADWRNYDVIPGDHPAYGGWVGYGRRDSVVGALQECDLLIGVGAWRTDVMSEGYSAALDAETVLVGTDPDVLAHAGRLDQHILSTVEHAVAALEAAGPQPGGRSADRVTALRASHERFTTVPCDGSSGRDLDLDRLFLTLEARLPADRVLTYGAGNATIWGHRYLTHREPRTLVGSRNGAMGMAVPATVAAALVRPEHVAVAVCGDGDFLMNGQEVATLVAQCASAKFVVVDNGRFGTIVDHQERHYPGRPSGTDMVNPDFVDWIESFGGTGVRIAADADVDGALDRFLSAEGPALVHVVVDPDLPAISGVGF